MPKSRKTGMIRPGPSWGTCWRTIALLIKAADHPGDGAGLSRKRDDVLVLDYAKVDPAAADIGLSGVATRQAEG